MAGGRWLPKGSATKSFFEVRPARALRRVVSPPPTPHPLVYSCSSGSMLQYSHSPLLLLFITCAVTSFHSTTAAVIADRRGSRGGSIIRNERKQQPRIDRRAWAGWPSIFRPSAFPLMLLAAERTRRGGWSRRTSPTSSAVLAQRLASSSDSASTTISSAPTLRKKFLVQTASRGHPGQLRLPLLGGGLSGGVTIKLGISSARLFR